MAFLTMKPNLASRLGAAEEAADRLAGELSSLRGQLGGGHFGLPEAADGAAGERDTVAALWAEVAALRVGVEKLAFENRLLWERVARQTPEPEPVAVPDEHAGDLSRIVQTLEREGTDAALREVEELEARAGEQVTATILRELAQILVESRPREALELAGRAQAIRPELATARLVQRAAGLAGDFPARIRAGDYILRNGGSGMRPAGETEQNWRDIGNANFFLNGIRHRPSGVPYPPPVYGRVLMSLHSSLPINRSGYTYRSHALLKGLKELGCDVSCCTRLGYPSDLRVLAAKEPESGFPAQDVVDGILYRRLIGPAALGRGGAPLDTYLANYAEALQMAIRRDRVHIVHTASNFPNAVAGYLAGRDARRPFVHEVRGFWELTGASRNPDEEVSPRTAEEARLEAEAARHADRVITLNGPMKSELVRRGIEADRIVIVPNGVNPKELSPMPKDQALARQLGLADAPTIGYVGSFVHYEGLDDLVLAFRLLKERGVRFNGLLVGDGETFEQLGGMVKDLGLAGEVVLTGRVQHDQVRRHYSLMDIAPFPRKPARVCELVSPIKPYEAMGMAKTVVVSDVAALAEMVEEGVTGHTFAKGDVGSLADRLELLVRNPELCRQVGEQSRKWVLEHRTWERSAATVRDLYREVAAEWAARRVLEGA